MHDTSGYAVKYFLFRAVAIGDRLWCMHTCHFYKVVKLC